MPIDQFTRAFYAMNKVLEEASQTLQLSKRAAVVLLILSDAEKGEMRTKDLVETFQRWFVSASHTAAKDVSIAKGELFQRDLIMARGGIRNIELTAQGRDQAAGLVAAIERALENLVAGQKDLLLIQAALSTIKPKMPPKPLTPAGFKETGRRRDAAGPGKKKAG